jgi:hypothetical protein
MELTFQEMKNLSTTSTDLLSTIMLNSSTLLSREEIFLIISTAQETEPKQWRKNLYGPVLPKTA